MLLDARLGNDANYARLHDALLRKQANGRMMLMMHAWWPLRAQLRDSQSQMMLMMRAWWAIVASQSLHDAHDARLVAVACRLRAKPKPNDAADACLVGHCGMMLMMRASGPARAK